MVELYSYEVEQCYGIKYSWKRVNANHEVVEQGSLIIKSVWQKSNIHLFKTMLFHIMSSILFFIIEHPCSHFYYESIILVDDQWCISKDHTIFGKLLINNRINMSMVEPCLYKVELILFQPVILLSCLASFLVEFYSINHG